MTRTITLAVATILLATPALAQNFLGNPNRGGRFDASLNSPNSRQVPNFQASRAGRLQTGSGDEAGGYARERTMTTGSLMKARKKRR